MRRSRKVFPNAPVHADLDDSLNDLGPPQTSAKVHPEGAVAQTANKRGGVLSGFKKMMRRLFADSPETIRAKQLHAAYKANRNVGAPALGKNTFRAMLRFMDKHRATLQEQMDRSANPHSMKYLEPHETDLALPLMLFRDGSAYVDMPDQYGQLGKGSFKTANKALNIDDGSLKAHVHNTKGMLHDVSIDLRNELNVYGKFGLDQGQSSTGIAGVHQIGLRAERADDGISREYHVSAMQELYPHDLRAQIDGTSKEAQPMTRPEKLDYAIDVLTGLDSMHRQDMVHGDIKPQNLLVTTDKGGLLTDFGLSQSASKSIRGGTPMYIHPSFIESSRTALAPEPDNPKAFDVYAMGLTLGELFGDASAVAQSNRGGRLVERHNDQDRYAAEKHSPLLSDSEREFAARSEVSAKRGYAKARKALVRGFAEQQERVGGNDPAIPEEQRIAHEMRNLDISQIGDASTYLKRFLALRDGQK